MNFGKSILENIQKIKNKILLLSSGDNGGAYEALYRLGKHFVLHVNTCLFQIRDMLRVYGGLLAVVGVTMRQVLRFDSFTLEYFCVDFHMKSY